jgi:sucrose-6-phosphate hydrolase SacC (GH32 family)
MVTANAPSNISCGSGCTFQPSVHACFTGPTTGGWHNLTLTAAAKLCILVEGCVSFQQQNTANGTAPAPTMLLNSTSPVKSGDCVFYAKHFDISHDPYFTAFHFQPATGHLMNDPNGPMHYNGLTHLFFQWNPTCTAAFCSREWGHAVSDDMIHWRELPIALNVSAFGACGGVWSGSADPHSPIVPTGGDGSRTRPLLAYSVQCNSYLAFAEPEDPGDPELRRWRHANLSGVWPRISKPAGTGGFRDPSQPWRGFDGLWRILAACNGGACLWTSTNLTEWKYVGHAAGTGQGSTWEMPDLFTLGGAGGQRSSLTVFKVGNYCSCTDLSP